MVVTLTVQNYTSNEEKFLTYIKLKSYKLNQYLIYKTIFQEGNHIIKNGCIMKVISLQKYNFDIKQILNFLKCDDKKKLKYIIYMMVQ